MRISDWSSDVGSSDLTGSGSSGGAGRALTWATHSSRFDAGSGPLVTLRPQAPSTRARPTASAPRTRLFDIRMSLPSLGVRRGCRGRGGLFLVAVAVGFHPTGELEAGVGADRDRKSTPLNPSPYCAPRMPSSV